MGSPYLNQLIQIAKVELPQLAHDAENASTIYTVQEIAKKLLNITMYLVHHVILSDPTVAAAQPAPAPRPAAPALPPPPHGFRYVRGADQKIYLEQIPVQPAVAMPMAAAVGHAPAVDHWPSQAPAIPAAAPSFLPPLVPPGQQAPETPGGPAVEVTITTQGSRVQVPGQPTMVIPPGAPIDAASALFHGRPSPAAAAIPVVAAPGVPGQPAEIVVAPALSPEVAAALAGRSEDKPIIDASGGARNVTNE